MNESTPSFSSTVVKVSGITAAELEVENASSRTSRVLATNRNGLIPAANHPISKYNRNNDASAPIVTST